MLFDDKGQIKTSPKELADILQKQFISVFSDPSKANWSEATFNPSPIQVPFADEFMEFTIDDIIAAIDKIDQNAASGPATLLKNCKNSIAIPIHLIWSHSLANGYVPASYKLSRIFLLHKKDRNSIPANYRPVSLTSHVVKVFERVLRKKMVEHLETNDLLCNNQHGFRSGRSCLTQLLHHFDNVLKALMNNQDFNSIYLDYAKAFDKVDHKILLEKLKLYGIHTTLINWIDNFLSVRMQGVIVNGHLSFLALIISGVPQGTVLGPILFIIFINDIDLCIAESIIRSFADDTCVSKPICQKDVSLLQNDLEKVILWSDNNNMTLHKDKFEYMSYLHNRQNYLLELPFVCEQFQYKVSDTTFLRPVEQLRDLGVTVLGSISVTVHLRNYWQSTPKSCMGSSSLSLRSKDIMLTLYKSMVRSQLEYCSPLWNPAKISSIQELESVQKVFTSKISGMTELNYWDRLRQLSLMSLQRRRERYIILHM